MSLEELLQQELDRNKELLDQYHQASRLPGVNTGFAAASIKHDIKLGEEALTSGDIIKMAQAYKRLQENN